MKTYHDIFDALDALSSTAQSYLRTDLAETDDSYRLDIDVAGFKKENINIELDEGYLTVTCKGENGDDKYISREIPTSVRRSYYVGKDLTSEMVTAKYENGILSLTYPKNAPKTESKVIPIA